MTTLFDIALDILSLAIFVWFFVKLVELFFLLLLLDLFNLTNCSVFNRAKHLSKYLFLSMMTAYLPLYCFIITIFWLFDKFRIVSLCLYGTFISEYFSQFFLNFTFILQNFALASGKFLMLFSKFWQKCSKLVYINFLLVLIEMCYSSPNNSDIRSSWLNKYEEKLCAVLLTNLETSFLDEEYFFSKIWEFLVVPLFNGFCTTFSYNTQPVYNSWK